MKYRCPKSVTGLVLVWALCGCATSGKQGVDPLEGFNRKMFAFNDKLDQVALKPAAKAYRAVLPSFAQLAIGNFFSNLNDVWTGVNNVLQGKFQDGATDFMRFAVNSTLGLGGVIDLSTLAGMPKHREDFGQTLGKWGVGAGPYIVLPLFGSSTLRDTAALPLDFKGDLWNYYEPTDVRNVGTVLRLLDARASVLDASDLIEGAALDRYEFVRDGFLQRRLNRVYDGDPPVAAPVSEPVSEENSTTPGSKNDAEGYVPAGTTPAPIQETKPPGDAQGTFELKSESEVMLPTKPSAAADAASTPVAVSPPKLAEATTIALAEPLEDAPVTDESFFVVPPLWEKEVSPNAF